MSEIILETKNLTKIYDGYKAVNDISISLEKGKIYGLIGKNGAGKTTLIRMLAGLIFPNSGEVSIYGETSEKGLAEGRQKMSFIVESPAFFPGFSAFENVKCKALRYGITDKQTITDLIKKVELDPDSKKKAADFSLGMKQRLGLAMSLVGNPEFIVLDEPTNGLDAQGIIDIRKLIREINRETGVTVLVSSHILAELSKVCDEFIIVDSGKLIKVISAEELEKISADNIIIGVSDPEKAAAVLREKLQISDIEIDGSKIKIKDKNIDINLIAPLMVEENIWLSLLTEEHTTLEDYFLGLIGAEGSDV
jgi:ABC-2 type transport system ATP-binding protein